MEYVAELEVEGFGQLQVVACVCRLEVHSKGGVYGPAEGTDSVRIWLEAPEAETSGEAVLAAAHAAVRSRELRIDGVTPDRAWVSSATFGFSSNSKLSYGEIWVDVRMPCAIPFPFSPGGLAPSKPGDPPFEEALVSAFAATQLPCVAAEIVETDRYWMFPVRRIGLLGSIVDRRSARVTLMGSGAPREVWMWAWEQGVSEEGTPVVLERCDNPTLLHERLRHVYRFEAADYERLPLTLPYDWRSFEPLYDSRDFVRVRAHKPS